MTVTTETNRTGPDVANGVTTVFSFTFPIQDQSHLKVTFADSAGAETVLTLATDYTVSIVGDAGSITLVDAAGLGAGTITMTRDIPFLQETDISNQGRLYLATAEGGFDLSVMRDQQLLEQLDRTLTIPVSAASGVSTEMPAPSANEIVGWNAAATALENKGSAPDVSTVSSIATEIVAVAGISSEIVAVAGIGSDITTAAANVTDIQNFADLYQISAAAPTQRADTTALQEGDLYYNTTTDDVWWYSGSAWLKVDTFDQSLNTTDSPAFAGLTVNGAAVVPADQGLDTTDSPTFAGATIAGVNPAAFGAQLLHVRDEKASSASGGTFTSGAWRTRDLNTVVTNEITGASLSSNQITLPAGTYYVQARAPAYVTDRHTAQLYNVTDAAALAIGSTSFSTTPAPGIQTDSVIAHRFTLSGTKVIELQHQCATTSATYGLGISTDFAAVSVYSDVQIWKVA